MPHDTYLVFDLSHRCRLSQAYLLFPYENHDPFRVFLPILFHVVFRVLSRVRSRVLLKRLGFPRVIIGYACAHTLFTAIFISSIKKAHPEVSLSSYRRSVPARAMATLT
jgi:hypothetical protein